MKQKNKRMKKKGALKNKGEDSKLLCVSKVVEEKDEESEEEKEEDYEFTKKKKGLKLKEQKNLNEFLSHWSDDSEDEETTSNKNTKKSSSTKLKEQKHEKNKKKKKSEKKSKKGGNGNNEEEEEEEEEMEVEEDDIDDDDIDDEDIGQCIKDQKSYLSSLQSKDPEFYKFLKENDEQLLNFDQDSDENDDSNDDEENEAHKPPSSLQVDSDDSDYEDEDEDEDDDDQDQTGSDVKSKSNKKKTTVTKKLLDEWMESMSLEKVPLNTLVEVVDAFKGAVGTIQTSRDKKSGDDSESSDTSHKFKVVGGAMFNGVIRLCLKTMNGALKSSLKLDPKAKTMNNISKTKHWSKINKPLKSYCTDLVQLIENISESSVISVLLKHVHTMIPYYSELPKASKVLIKALIGLWSSAEEESVRILAFLSILRLTQSSQSTLLEPVMKQMYLSYVKNCKFVSPSTQSHIGFMRRSLAELMNLNHGVTYHHAFVYIRQLAIHLRNAITLKKKDSLQSVYNWQFVQSIHLWATLLGSTTHPSKVLEPLIHPLVQIMTGTITLQPIPKYYPLRFHICRMLTNLSRETGKFIPILPYLTDILENYNFNKRTKKLSMKPLDFGCILKCSKSQLLENGFKDTTMENVYVGIIELLNNHSHKISFPEFVTPLNVSLKSFLKKTKVPNYSKKIKQCLDKMNENSKFLETKRRKVNFGIQDFDAIAAWELKIKSDGTPVSKFYNNWKKVQDHEKLKMQAKIEGPEDDYDFIPSIINKKEKKQKTKANDDFKGDILDQGEEDSDLDDDERFKLKEDRGKKRKKEDLSDDEDEDASDEEDDVNEQDSDNDIDISHKNKKQKIQKEPEEDDDEEEVDDQVEDLNLEDLESENEEDDEVEEEEDNEDDEDDEDDSDDDEDDSD